MRHKWSIGTWLNGSWKQTCLHKGCGQKRRIVGRAEDYLVDGEWVRCRYFIDGVWVRRKRVPPCKEES